MTADDLDPVAPFNAAEKTLSVAYGLLFGVFVAAVAVAQRLRLLDRGRPW